MESSSNIAFAKSPSTISNKSEDKEKTKSDFSEVKEDHELLKKGSCLQQTDYFVQEIEAAKIKVSSALKILQKCEKFSSQESCEAFEAITLASMDESRRKILGDYLAEIGYAELYVNVMKWLSKSSDAECSEDLTFVGEMMGGYWNFSDGSPLLCQRLGECGVVNILFEDMKDTDVAIMAANRLKKEKKRHHFFAKLGILHNCIRLHSNNRAIYRKANAVRILTNFLQEQKVAVYVKTICLLILAYIVDETESERLASSGTGGCVNFLITMLRKALNAENQRYGGFSTSELLEGINHLSLNDANKVKTVEGGCLQLMTLMMGQGRSEDEQLLAARGVWRLAFVSGNKRVIRENDTLINALKQLQKSKNQYLRKVSTGALWEIYEGKIQLADTPSVKVAKNLAIDGPHVMISYQWDVQSQMIILKNLLNSHGYNVWMDIEKMEGNILAAMARAVEKAAVVLVCVSQKYKDSESCRTEASYAYKKKKAIIPLMVEEGYDPDGWLGVLIGMHLYFPMYSEDQVQQQLVSLIQELGERGRREKSEIDQIDGGIIPKNMTITATAPSIPSQSKNDLLEKWTPSKFQSWLQDIGMNDLRQHLSYCDGSHLIQMYRQCKSCPEYFHSALRTDLKMDFHAVLKFTTALEKLFLSIN